MTYDGPTELYVNGEWVSAESGETIATEDPASEATIAEVECAGAEDVQKAVAAADAAAARDGEWRSMDPRERGRALHAMADYVEDSFDDIVMTESRDNGKTPFEARIDVSMAADTFRYFAGWADKVEGSQIPVPGDRLDYTVREPLGVTGHITPWNYPFQLASRSLAPALATGNTVVLKPAEQTPLSALHYGLAAEAAGLPDGVVNVVPGYGEPAGETLASSPDVDHVAFTGSTAVGKQVMGNAAKNVTDVTLELGGKGPNVVFPDADLDAATQGIQYGIFMNAGQMCWAGSRLLVHEDVHDEVVDRVVGAAENTPLGSGIDDDGRMGPLVSAEQHDRVTGYIETGREEGAELLCGGGRPESHEEGYFVEPTVFDGVDNEMTIARDEIFGPVLSVIEFADREEALDVANDSPYGLMAGVWTGDLKTGHWMADRLDYGMVSVNEYPVTHPQTPFGGVKQSGLGREQGAEAVRAYTQTKNVNVNYE